MSSNGNAAKPWLSPFLAMGRYAAGSLVASANVATRVVSRGVRTGARTAGAVAAAASGVVPGAELARRLAATVDREAAAAEQQASRRAADSVRWLDGGRASWTEIAADTAAGPLSDLAALSAAVGVESFRTAAATRPGRAALDAVLRNVNGAAARRDADGQREALVVLVSDSGTAAIRGGFSLAEMAVRLAFSDTRRLGRALADGLEQMRLLAASGEMHELLPVPVVSEALQERARQVADRAPRRFLSALGDPSPRFAEILAAMLDDADELRVFVFAYPQVATLVVTRVGRLLAAGSLGFSDVEAFFEGRQLAGQLEPRPAS